VIILITGKAGSGKDVVGDYLKEKYKFHKLSIATSLKSIFRSEFNLTKDELKKYKNIFRTTWKISYFKDIDDKLYNKLLNRYKDENREFKGLIEHSKTTKELIYEDYFIEYLIESNKPIIDNPVNKIVIPDWRFLNELGYINKNVRNHKVYTLRIVADENTLNNRGYKLLDDISENELNNYDTYYTLENNNDDLESLYNKIEEFVRKTGL
jgi:hypothetical protein